MTPEKSICVIFVFSFVALHCSSTQRNTALADAFNQYQKIVYIPIHPDQTVYHFCSDHRVPQQSTDFFNRRLRATFSFAPLGINKFKNEYLSFISIKPTERLQFLNSLAEKITTTHQTQLVAYVIEFEYLCTHYLGEERINNTEVSSRFRFAVSIANIETRLVLGTIRGDKRIDWETDQNKFEEMLVRDTIIDAYSYYKTQIGPK